MTQKIRNDLAIILLALGVVAFSLVAVFQYLVMANLDLWSSLVFFVAVCLLLIASYALGFIVLTCIVIPILQLKWLRMEAKTD